MGDISLPLEEKAPPVIIDTTTVLPVEPEVVICTAQPPLQVEEIPTELLDTLPQAILNNMDNNEWIPVGISEGADDNIQPQFAAYPVPGDQYINFTTTLNEPFDMHVFDAAGKKLSGIIYARGQYTLDVSSYPSGTYYVLMVVNNHAVETRKIIVRHP